MKRFKRIYIEITNNCNLNCSFCPKTERKLESMTLNSFVEILKKIKNYTDYIYLHVKGEPLLHKDLDRILLKASEYGKSVIITTNGTLLKEKIDILKNSKSIRQINISLHSAQDNKINIVNYMDEIINSAEEINSFNNCYISYRLWNLESLKKPEKNAELLQILEQRYNIENIINKAKQSSFIDLGNNKYINLDTIFEWPDLRKKAICVKGSCYGLINQIAILVDGTIVPCCLDDNGIIKLGNIFTDSIEEVLNSKLAVKIINGFRENHLIHPLCQKCGFREEKRQ